MGYFTQQEMLMDRLEKGSLDLSPIDAPQFGHSDVNRGSNEADESSVDKGQDKTSEKEAERDQDKTKEAAKRTRREKPVMTTQPFLTPPVSKSGSGLSSAETQMLRRRSEGSKPVIFSSGLDSKKLSLLAVAKAQLGGELLSDFSPNATHLVVSTKSDNITARTIKYLLALLSGITVVRFEWILESVAAKSWLDATPYLISGDTHATGAPGKVRSDIQNYGKPTLFRGKTFYFSPGPYSDRAPDVKSLKEIVALGGCEAVLETPPEAPKSITELYESNVILIFDPDVSQERIQSEFYQLGRKSTDFKWILNSLSRYELEPLDAYAIPVSVESIGVAIETQQSAEF